MAAHSSKYKKSKYKYVYGDVRGEDVFWVTQVPGHSKKRYDSERSAAIAVDKIMLSNGKEALNILVKK